jgi:hypothetical protein
MMQTVNPTPASPTCAKQTLLAAADSRSFKPPLHITVTAVQTANCNNITTTSSSSISKTSTTSG